MQRWKPSGARLNARPWKEANNGPRIGFDGSYSNSSKRLITGAGSTALWGINHLWTSNKTTTKNGKDRVKYCDHKKGGREFYQAATALSPIHEDIEQLFPPFSGESHRWRIHTRLLAARQAEAIPILREFPYHREK